MQLRRDKNCIELCDKNRLCKRAFREMFALDSIQLDRRLFRWLTYFTELLYVVALQSYPLTRVLSECSRCFCHIYLCVEAEYAYQRRKRMIPLMMESNYSPDGWLGIILGSKLWMDFRKNPSVGLQQLTKEISKARVGMYPLLMSDYFVF